MASKVSKCLYITFLISFFIISFARFASTADEASQKAKELSNLKKDVEKIKKQKKGVIQKERNLLSELSQIDKQLDTKEKELDIYTKNLDRIEKELIIAQHNLAYAEKNLKQTQEMLNLRLKAIYKLGYQNQRVSYLKLLIDSSNISDITSKYTYLSSIAEADKKLLEKAINQRSDVIYQKKMVEEKRQHIAQNKSNTEKVKIDILGKKQTKNVILGKVRKDKEELTKAQIELESSINRLERLIAQLKRSQDQNEQTTKKKNFNTIPYKDSNGGLNGQVGQLMWPTFGEVIENQAPSMKGVTIKANHGEAIKCVDDGKVDYARWFDGVGFGNMIIIDHGNGYRTLYAHISKILVKEGQLVKKGQKIAEVGDTGSLNGASLYFEIWRGTEALSTRRWLGGR